MTTPEAVLLQVLTQDPAVITAGPRPLTPVQPVVAHARRGFWEGPACERVAVVDLLADGEIGAPVGLDPTARIYEGVAQYQVATPRVRGAWNAPWARQAVQTTLGRLGDRDADQSFLPVSVFGTVIRAITFIEDPVVLGRRVEWAFGDRRILVVPRGRGQQNAFYHRPSGSLRFYSFPSETGSAELVHTGLSQDIVTHETTHALVDGIAPDLYAAIGPDALAIHEAVADFTAAMISLRNRELTDPRSRTAPAAALADLRRPSRYSRVAEQFGGARTHRDALRDTNNRRTLSPLARAPGRVVDPSSPHSLSEVLSGALFAVLVSSVESALDAPPKIRADPFRSAVLFAINRLGSLVFRGLDWLPPGEVTLADAIRAMLAADGVNHPDRPDERRRLAEECVRRRIIARGELEVLQASGGGGAEQPFDGMRAAAGPALHDAVIERARRLAPPDSVFDVTSRRLPRASAVLVEQRHVGESVQLDREYPHAPAAPAITLVKVAWWETRDIDLGTEGRETLAIRTGLTIVLDDGGRPVTVLRSAESPASDGRRRAFRTRLAQGAAAGAHTPTHDDAGAAAAPRAADGTPAVRHATGSFALLHVAGLEDLRALPAIPAPPRVARRRRSGGKLD